MTKHVVLDDSSLWALLRLGYREGLVRMRSGVRLHQLIEDSDPELEQQVLEQVVLTPNLFGFFDRGSLCEDLVDGDLVDSETLARTPTPKALDDVEALPFELVVGILRAQGYRIPESEFLPRLGAAMAYEDARNRRAEEGRRFPDLGDHLAAALGNNVLTEEEWAFYREHQDAHSNAAPIVSAFLHAQEVMTAAAQHGAHGMLPYATTGVDVPLRNPGFAGSESPQELQRILFRVVSRDVGMLLPPPSLTSALKLAKSPEAEALREKSAEWIAQIESGELGGLDPIRKELKAALRSLEKTGKAKSVGTMITYVSVSISAAEMFLGSPGVIGFALGAVGLAAQAEVSMTERRYRWALFGRR